MSTFKCSAKELKTLNSFKGMRKIVKQTVNVFLKLFISANPSKILRKIKRVETRTDVSKRQIIYLTKQEDGPQLLNYLQKLNRDDFSLMGKEFFFVTSKRFSKKQSVKDYSLFLKILMENFGFDVLFMKGFLSMSRNREEIEELILSVKNWEESINKQVVQEVVLSCLEKISSSHKTFSMLILLRESKQLFKDNVSHQTILEKLLLNSLTHIILDEEGNLFEDILTCIEEMGLNYNSNIFNKLLEMINKSIRSVNLIDILFSFMEKKQNIIDTKTLNSFIECYSVNGRFDKAYILYNSFKVKDVLSNENTYNILLRGIKSMSTPDTDLTSEIFSRYELEPFDKTTKIYNSFISVFINNEEKEEAEKIYKKMVEEKIGVDQATLNIIIKGCIKNQDIDSAVDYYRLMRESDFKTNRITFNSLLNLCVKKEKLDVALKLLEEMQDNNIRPDGFTYSILLNGLKINEASLTLVENTLEKLKIILDRFTFKLDEIIFNSVFDICGKYNLPNQLDFFYRLMKSNNIRETHTTFSILLKSYCSLGQYKKTIELFKTMIDQNLSTSEIIYGSILDSCCKAGEVEVAVEIYKILRQSNIGLNSIVFTTILTGYIKKKMFSEAICFFDGIKDNTELSGMLITYNCALDIHARNNDTKAATDLFNLIEEKFGADIISYSTIIKALCSVDEKKKALKYIKEMIHTFPNLDISVVNLFLDSCSSKEYCKLGISGYHFAMSKGIIPNEVTFGIMIKLYGFSREVKKAFDLLDLMAVYDIKPSIVIYTNLIHISFYNSKPKKAELAFCLFKKDGLEGDCLLYSKIIEGLFRYKETNRIGKYIKLAVNDECGLKEGTINKILKKFSDNKDILDNIKLIREFGKKIKKKLFSNKFDRYNNKNITKPSFNNKKNNGERRFNVRKKNVNDENKRVIGSDGNKRTFGEKRTGFKTQRTNTDLNKGKKPFAIFNFRQKNK